MGVLFLRGVCRTLTQLFSMKEVPYYIAEPKGFYTSSMLRRLDPAASKSIYALCSGSLIRKIEMGWGSTM